MGAHVIEQARRPDAKIVVAGTICAYPKFTPVPFSEDALWNGYPEETNAPYGMAKKALRCRPRPTARSTASTFVILLPVNLYGPGDNFDPAAAHVIPALIRKCVDARERGADAHRGLGHRPATREFLFVDDAAEGIVLAAERYEGAEPVNLGADDKMSTEDLVKIAADARVRGRDPVGLLEARRSAPPLSRSTGRLPSSASRPTPTSPRACA